MTRKFAFAAIASLGFLLSACGGGDAPAPPPPPRPTAAGRYHAADRADGSDGSRAVGHVDARELDRVDRRQRNLRAIASSATPAPPPVSTVTTTSFTDTGLTASTTYSYTVVAVDGAATPNVSAASAAVSAATSAPPPPARRADPTRRAARVRRADVDRRAFAAARAARHQPLGRRAAGRPRGQLRGQPPMSAPRATCSTSRDRVVFRNVHGLLGLAFHPDFPTDNRAWVAYTHETSPDVIVLRVSAFTTADNGATLNPASEQIVFEMAQPGGHNNGGHLLFGPDGYLYIGMGDGGNDDSDSAQAGNGQLTNNLLGKILRIDVSGTTGSRLYRIPADNPFAANALCNFDGTGTTDCPEIFAWGFRNPWRWTFDSASGALWLGDVGSHTREEIDLVIEGWQLRLALQGGHARYLAHLRHADVTADCRPWPSTSIRSARR